MGTKPASLFPMEQLPSRVCSALCKLSLHMSAQSLGRGCHSGRRPGMLSSGPCHRQPSLSSGSFPQQEQCLNVASSE